MQPTAPGRFILSPGLEGWGPFPSAAAALPSPKRPQALVTQGKGTLNGSRGAIHMYLEPAGGRVWVQGGDGVGSS